MPCFPMALYFPSLRPPAPPSPTLQAAAAAFRAFSPSFPCPLPPSSIPRSASPPPVPLLPTPGPLPPSLRSAGSARRPTCSSARVGTRRALSRQHRHAPWPLAVASGPAAVSRREDPCWEVDESRSFAELPGDAHAHRGDVLAVREQALAERARRPAAESLPAHQRRTIPGSMPRRSCTSLCSNAIVRATVHDIAVAGWARALARQKLK